MFTRHGPQSYRTHGIDPRTPQGRFSQSAEGWPSLPAPVRAAFNSLCARMQQAGLFPAGPRQSGYTLFIQMNAAFSAVYGWKQWTEVPRVPAPPPAVPEFAVTGTESEARTAVRLTAPAFGTGCQVWLSKPFVPGCRDPFAQRVKMVGALPNGWPDGGTDLSGILGKGFWVETGMAFVVKLVPVSRDGFVGPPLSQLCVVE